MLCLEEFSINEDFKGIRLNVKMVDCKHGCKDWSRIDNWIGEHTRCPLIQLTLIVTGLFTVWMITQRLY